MLDFLGYGAIIWLGSKIIEEGMEAHYSAKTMVLNSEFSAHLSRLQQERKNERWKRYRMILHFLAEYEELIEFRIVFFQDIHRRLMRCEHPNADYLAALEGWIFDPADGSSTAPLGMLRILSQIGRLSLSDPDHEVLPVLLSAFDSWEQDFVETISKTINVFFLIEKNWIQHQNALFQLDFNGRKLEKQYYQVLENVVPNTQLVFREL
jgi:hypothetical protein